MIPFSVSPVQSAKELSDFSQNLVKGVKNLSRQGEIDTGVSDREEVYREDKLVLYRYTPRVKKPFRVPVMIVYALVNRPYMADLQEDRSLVKGLLDEGMDVYLIDWGYPDEADRFIDLDYYINGYIKRCAETVAQRHGLPSINVLGICQGGALSISFAALNPGLVKNLVTMVTPVDFQTDDNLLSCWAQGLDVDLMVDAMGNVPGGMLNTAFLSMKPFQSGKKYLDMVSLMNDPDKLKNFMRMEKWIFDSPDQAGQAFREFIKFFYQGNGFVNGNLEIGGREVNLKELTMPVLNVYALGDHLVPPKASKVLADLVGTDDYTELPFKGGHIGIFVGGRAQREVPPGVSSWLQQRG